MKRSIRDIPKKRGRPVTTGKGTGLMVRLHAGQLALIDAWIVRQGEPPPSRPEALRRLAEIGLSADATSAGKEKPKRARVIPVGKLNASNDG